MSRKKRRSQVHYLTFGYRDGATTNCLAKRKPRDKELKDMGDHVDADFVYREYHHGFNEIYEWGEAQRSRASDTLANRINTRRAIRELVLPELEAIQKSLASLHDRLDQLEQQINPSPDSPT